MKILTALVTAAVLAACTTPPQTRFHTLQPLPDAVAVARASVAAGGPAAELVSLQLPPSLAQPQLALRQRDGGLLLLEHERWIAPLDQELAALVRLRLGERPAAGAPWRLWLDVLQWEASAEHGLHLAARWRLERAGEAARLCRIRIERAPAASIVAVAQRYAEAAQALAKAVADSVPGAAGAGGCSGGG